MPLKKILLKPGVNRENTRYTNEGGWYESDKVRFRQGTPEKIGGWSRISTNTFLGVCRSLWNWVTLSYLNLMGVGTSKKFYIESGGAYNDITPIRSTSAPGSVTFAATNGSAIITVTHTAHGAANGDYVTFFGAASLGGNITAAVLNAEYSITVVNSSSYTFTASATANASDVGNGGAAAYAAYQLSGGADFQVPFIGWGSGAWGSGAWGVGVASTEALRIWNQQNFGEDLIYGPAGKSLYYWNATFGFSPSVITVTIAAPAVVTFPATVSEGDAVMFYTTGALPTGLSPGVVYYVKNASGATSNLSATYDGAAITTTGTQSGVHYLYGRGIALASQPQADSAVPLFQNALLVSDSSRFVFVFGTNDYGATTIDPMLLRWSDQESAVVWYPAATNQAGSLRLSHGSNIVTAIQSRQEVLVFTDSALYSLQYLGPPIVWGSQILADNVSIIGQNAVALASGVVYWMGVDKFYKFDGRTQTLRCDLLRHIYSDINLDQNEQCFASTNEGFNEIWWFYCSANSTVIDKYVVYNYGEDIWYYGSMSRTAWIDSGLRNYPNAATYSNNLVSHELGLNDNTNGNNAPIEAFILSSEFDIADGYSFGFIWRVLPDITFRGSTAASPTATLTLYPLQNSGSGYTAPPSVAGQSYADISRTAVIPVEQFTGQVYIRVRGRQFAMKIASNEADVQWQLGAPRIDIRPDGRR